MESRGVQYLGVGVEPLGVRHLCSSCSKSSSGPIIRLEGSRSGCRVLAPTLFELPTGWRTGTRTLGYQSLQPRPLQPQPLGLQLLQQGLTLPAQLLLYLVPPGLRPAFRALLAQALVQVH